MGEFEFLVNYTGRAWVTVEADNVEEAKELLCNESCLLEDYAMVRNSLNFEINIEKEVL
jgi:hypothetical protein